MNTNSANSAYEKNEKTVDKYIKAIKKEFPIYRKGEKRYLKMLRSSMYDYAVSFEGELITVSHLSKKFGSPKDCANTYIEYLGTDTICHNMNGKKYGKYIFITALSVILVYWVLQYVYQLCCIRNGRYPDVVILHQLLLSFKMV